MISAIFWGAGAFFLLRIILRYHNDWELRRLETRDFENWQSIAQKDPTNASAWGNMADYYAKHGEIEAAIENYRRAINLMPHGPFSQKWKSRLKDVLRAQEALARGEKVPGFYDQRACHSCHKLVPASARRCPHCDAILYMGPIEFLTQPHIARQWARETLVISVVLVVVLWMGGTLFTALPIEWKGVIIMASVIVGGFYLLRIIGGEKL